MGSVLLFAIGGWYAVTRQARFQLGGDDLSNRHPIHVDAHGLDALAIACVFLGLGAVNLALGIRGRARLPVFWMGAAALGAAAVYGLSLIVADVAAFLRQ